MAPTEASSSALVGPTRKWVESIFKRIAEGFQFYILRELYKLLLNILTYVWIDGFGVLTWFLGLYILLNLYLSAHIIIMGENKNDAYPDWSPARETWQRRARALYSSPATSILSWALLYIHTRPPKSVLPLLRNIMLAQNSIFCTYYPNMLKMQAYVHLQHSVIRHRRWEIKLLKQL